MISFFSTNQAYKNTTYKKAILLWLGVCLILVAWCSSSKTTETNEQTSWDAIPLEQTNTGLQFWSWWEIVTWTITTSPDSIQKILNDMGDVAIQDNSRSFFQNESLSIRINSWDTNVRITKQDDIWFLTIDYKWQTFDRWKKESTDNGITNILWLQESYVNVYGPFLSLYTGQEGQSSIIYTTATFDNRWQLEQHTFNLDTKTEIENSYYYLYRTLNNSHVIATKIAEQWWLFSFEWLHIAKSWQPFETISTHGFDGYAFDGFYIFTYIIDRNTELSNIEIRNSQTWKKEHILNDVSVGWGWARMLLKDNLLTISYGETDSFENVANYITQYDMSTKNLIWTIKTTK